MTSLSAMSSKYKTINSYTEKVAQNVVETPKLTKFEEL